MLTASAIYRLSARKTKGVVEGVSSPPREEFIELTLKELIFGPFPEREDKKKMNPFVGEKTSCKGDGLDLGEPEGGRRGEKKKSWQSITG